MKRKWAVLFGCTAILAVAIFRFGSQKYVLENSSQFTLYSLQPQSMLLHGSHDDPIVLRDSKKLFYGHIVLGETQITDASIQNDLVAALYHAIAENKGTVAACFNPRHAIRAQWGLRTIDVVICFECYQADFRELGQHRTVYLNPSAQPLFDRVLKQAKVPLGKREQK